MTFHFNPGQQRALDQLLTRGKRNNLIYGGSRSGKTALFCSCIQDRALLAPESRHLIIRKDKMAVKAKVMKDTFPKMWKLRYPDAPAPIWNEQYGYMTFPNGSEVWAGGTNDEKAMERILGGEYATIFINEASELPYSAFTLLETRLAQVVPTMEANGSVPLSQRFYIDLNPTTRMHWTYRLWQEGVNPEDGSKIDESQYGYIVINPHDNRENLSGDYLTSLENLSERAKKRFLYGEYISDDDNALWRREYIDKRRTQRREDGGLPVEMRRVVVAIDPAVTSEPGSDETGIVVVGQGVDGMGYVLEDESGKYRPEEWARRAVSLFKSTGADRIIGEVNNGGDLIESQLRAVDPSVPYRAVRATRGKAKRAEPVAALYERGKIFHVGTFPELEDQMCAVTVDFDSKATGWSPDRVDALVWGFTELFPALSAQRQHGGPLPAPKLSMV